MNKDEHCYHPHGSNGGGYAGTEVVLHMQSTGGNIKKVKGIQIRGRRDSPQWLKKAEICVSKDNTNWTNVGTFNICHDQRTIITVLFPKTDEWCQIRIKAVEFQGVPVMNVGVIVKK